MYAALAVLAVRDSQWEEAGTAIRAALAAARGTFRHPFPAVFLSDALMGLALDGPPALADSVLRAAVRKRPGSARWIEFSAVAALRAGHCDLAAAAFIELHDFAIDRADAPALVRDCWRRSDVTTRAAGSRR
jgi:hypothetical protein